MSADKKPINVVDRLAENARAMSREELETAYVESAMAYRAMATIDRRSGWSCPACGCVNGPLVKRCACGGNKTLRERVHSP